MARVLMAPMLLIRIDLRESARGDAVVALVIHAGVTLHAHTDVRPCLAIVRTIVPGERIKALPIAGAVGLFARALDLVIRVYGVHVWMLQSSSLRRAP